ncbi:RagB/SusD family nutrient uptake outer membrane protein [Winogradskyella bathintestinalis]|uniref:RagB/SusD family nutrient uptake outer membrane protein n=1 Tax=Winogradskyella bathintestinalis TaxID=3035208 RepID=A0ABT7ZR90_9FLAO|nr:RagB/SusD family nutrient uptake outer membrane protein [Winogradskyella bathintestinalis]MDN3491509.1 RagB/SusD family nutrient uptake outer membrane protein [Winogradskyella bathintestinalis]
MKNLFKLIIVFSVLLTITSCSDDEFLEQTSPDQLTTENFWRNAEDAQSGLVAAYSELESRSNFWDGWQEGRPVIEYFKSDYALPGPDASNYAHWMSIFNFSYTNGHTFIDVLWTTNYKGLNFSNQVITKVGEMTSNQISDAEKRQIIGEATFLRAYYHFKLLTLYDKIILRTEIISNETLDKPLASRPESWEVVINDFTEAADMLQTADNTEPGRATKGAALAYLGKAYMYKAGDLSSAESSDFQNAVSAFEPIINGSAGAYDLESDFSSLFNGENENNIESIFELQFKSGDATSWNATRLHAFVGDWSIGGWGGLAATMNVVNEMKSEGMVANNGLYDNRLYGSLYFRDPFYNNTSTNEMQGSTWDVLMNDTYGNTNENAAYFRKWLPNYVSNSGYVGVNVVLMRYADVLLMYAEALNETGDTPQAINIINEIRAVHGLMPPITVSSQADVKNQIIHERTMELTLESVRFFDLRRWGMLDQAMQAAGRTGFNAESHAYLPVPLSEIQSNSQID